MTAIFRFKNDESGKEEVALIIGTGLIGSAVADQLVKTRNGPPKYIDIDWRSSGQEALYRIVDQCCAIIDHQAKDGEFNLRVLWSAGAAGFGSDESQASKELEVFLYFISATRRLAEKLKPDALTFVLASSAGGLYEGFRLAGYEEQPALHRPYARLKLEQEQALLAADHIGHKHCLRLTSVYGYVRPKFRTSLIAAMIRNGVLHRVTRITGRMTTLRDFIWIEDLAKEIIHALFKRNSPQSQPISHIGSGKPASIFEIQTIIEEVLGRQLYIAYEHDASNAAHITLLKNDLLSHATSLKTNIRKIYEDLIAQGITSV